MKDATLTLRLPPDLEEVLDLEAQLLPQPTLPTHAPRIDPDDVPRLAAAAAGRADVFVTGDNELLELGEYRGMQIRSPRAAWPSLG